MDENLDFRLRADRALVDYLCKTTGKSASSLATGAGMAPTTLNRFLSSKTKVKSTLKDVTIRKIAEYWHFDYLALIGYRRRIEQALRENKPTPDFDKDEKGEPGGMREQKAGFTGTRRDPLMDQIMGATYDVWFNSAAKQTVAFETLPELVRLIYSRIRQEPKTPALPQIKKRAADMLAAMGMETAKKK